MAYNLSDNIVRRKIMFYHDDQLPPAQPKVRRYMSVSKFNQHDWFLQYKENEQLTVT